MGKIYLTASEVVTWLGPPIEGLQDVIWATTKLLPYLKMVQSHETTKAAWFPTYSCF
jgi:hypothetical protein